MTSHGRPAPLQRTHVHCPVTAIAVLSLSPDNIHHSQLCILSGEDTHLKIRDVATSQLRASVQVFNAQPIQGIDTAAAETGGDILVWGGPWVALISRDRILDSLQHGGDDGAPAVLRLSRTEVLRAPDWFYHASLSHGSTSLGAVVTAHNEVIPLHVGKPAGQEQLRLSWGRVRAPPSRPILYSAQVRWIGAEQVLVAAGTVFGEIVVWRCRVSQQEDDSVDEVEVLYVFTGHEGSIFGVDISREIPIGESPQKMLRLLASCSDDRTIRVWDISEAMSSSILPVMDANRGSKTGFPEARETGFGENTPSELGVFARHVSSMPLAMAMGHVSRIWSVRFAPPKPIENTGSLALYSFGEDATAQRWRLDLDGRGIIARLAEGGQEWKDEASLTHEAIIHRHTGKHIWSSAVSGFSKPTQDLLVVTGGSDGKINAVEETTASENSSHAVMIDISGSEITSSLSVAEDERGGQDIVTTNGNAPERRQSAPGEPFLMYALLSDGAVIATTLGGRVFRGLLSGSDLSWTEVQLARQHQDDLKRYQVVRSIGASAALLGSISGHLYMYRGSSVRQIYKAPGKIADIFSLPADSIQGLGIMAPGSSTSQSPIIVSTMGSPQARLLFLDVLADETVQREVVVELEKGFIVTAVGCCQDYLIFGSRSGALVLYKSTQDKQGGFEEVTRVERRTKDSVACVIALPSKAGVPSPYFLTTSRDGRYRIYEIKPATTPGQVEVRLRHEAVPPLGPLIESAYFTPSTPDTRPELILAGFRSRSFIIWNETRQLEVANVECGGGHRSFTYRVGPYQPERVSFIWTRAARTCIYAQAGLSQVAVKRGGHGREIKAVAARGGAGELLATGAEDTTVRIWRHVPGSTGDELRCLAVVERHTTGIQCLRWAGENYLISSSGNEEMFVWRVTQLEGSDYEAPAVMCEAAYPDKTRDGDLRITSFDVEVMSADAAESVDGEEEVLCLSLVLSNSTLKTYRYSKSRGFMLLADGRYTGACPMQIRHLRVAVTNKESRHDAASLDLHVLTASTDGHIALWRTTCASGAASSTSPPIATAEHVLVEAHRLHQSGLKALDLHALPHTSPPSYALLTGGDDDALGHARLDWTDDGQAGRFTCSARSVAGGAHAAAITGLCVTGVVADPRGGLGYRVELCTASNDQRVRAWRVDVDVAGRAARMVLVGDRYSAVADCGDMERLEGGEAGAACGGRGVVVAGVGMEFWTV